MNILVRYHGIFAQMAACREERLTLPEGASVLDALKLVGRQHPPLAEALFLANGAPAPYARPFVNGAMVAAEGLLSPMQQGDELALLPALSGGGFNRLGSGFQWGWSQHPVMLHSR
jgi:molybdopterin converting factor small subunit